MGVIALYIFSIVNFFKRAYFSKVFIFNDIKELCIFIRSKFLIFRGIFVYVLTLDIFFYFEISPKIKIHIKLKYDTFVEHFMKHMFLFSVFF